MHIVLLMPCCLPNDLRLENSMAVKTVDATCKRAMGCHHMTRMPAVKGMVLLSELAAQAFMEKIAPGHPRQEPKPSKAGKATCARAFPEGGGGQLNAKLCAWLCC